MSRFLRFLLASYAPMAARHALFDAQWFRPQRRNATRAAAGERGSEEQTSIDIGGDSRRSSAARADPDSLVA
jgi:LAS superfamily LD-carboxypeptidase LdcB